MHSPNRAPDIAHARCDKVRRSAGRQGPLAPMKTGSCRLRRSQGRQPQRGCVLQPGVAPRYEGLPRESTPARRPNPERVTSMRRIGAIAPAPPAQGGRNPVGVKWNSAPVSPGSGGYAATRGYGMEPRWGSQGVTRFGDPTRGHPCWPRKRREETRRDLPNQNSSVFSQPMRCLCLYFSFCFPAGSIPCGSRIP